MRKINIADSKILNRESIKPQKEERILNNSKPPERKDIHRKDAIVNVRL
jgi:hypothetical protein